ncbi:pheromone-regulated membrane protein 10 [Favolaschia claudopus]|uniref:Pheromone-regulated membrane protein 10 n=1 Tax=Favolaschia claudopus TaxID=2862362 RepID=A0AAW0DTK4_9AGAR
MSATIRKATIADEPGLSHICLVTADAGKSAEHLHDYKELPGLVYSVPYLSLPTTWAFVLADGPDVVGYIVGSTDTRAYEKYASEHWWPVQAEEYQPKDMVKEGDKKYAALLRKMHTAPDANIAFSPAHMHINILESYRGQGWGRKMIQTAVDHLKGEGINKLWLGMDPRNKDAGKFYERLGFRAFEGSSPTDENHDASQTHPNSASRLSSHHHNHFHRFFTPSSFNRPTSSLSPAHSRNMRPESPQPRETVFHQSTLRSGPEWTVPIYTGRADDTQSIEEFPIRRPSNTASMDSRDSEEDFPTKPKRFSFNSSHEHPYDITPPTNSYSGAPQLPPLRSALRNSVSFAEPQHSAAPAYAYDEETRIDTSAGDRAQKRRGVLSNMMDLYALENDIDRDTGRRRDSQDSDSYDDDKDYKEPERYTARPDMRRMDSTSTDDSDIYDPDDPKVTGVKPKDLEGPQDLDKDTLRGMNYHSRRKHLMRAKIEFNVTSMINRQTFLIQLARALMTFGAPSHRIESQLNAAARILEVEAEFIHIPGVIICAFGDPELGCTETHFIKCSGRLSLGALHDVHLVYRKVVHDEISAETAERELGRLLEMPEPYTIFFRCCLAFFLSALICPLAFGGSLVDMWIAGLGAFVLSILQLAATKSAIYANVFEITTAIFVSFLARGLSSIRDRIFCYTAISSSGIIGILPGYLILTSSLELASKNIVCGSVKMVYALIYTLFLGFGLQIGSDFYLLLDRSARRDLYNVVEMLNPVTTLTGTWTADNRTASNSSIPPTGTWAFLYESASETDIIEGCYRPRTFPTYLQPFPFWTHFLIVPVFSTLSSLANLQPYSKGKELVVMVAISCSAYATNKVANHYIFNRSDVVSAIGAFTIGVLGNVYSRKMGGTAFTSMVTGVLFLVPSGLSQAGGITANGGGIEIGGAMIAVTIGITVGLFMSQALVYTFGYRKNAAIFSF